jgi:type I restriction enzyme, R subunit
MNYKNQNPEQIARDKIDALLEQAGWKVQSIKKMDLNAALGVAVREYQTDVGPADYVLFVDKKPVGQNSYERMSRVVQHVYFAQKLNIQG